MRGGRAVVSSDVCDLAETEPGTRGCLILDMRLPGMTGLQLQQRLSDQHWDLPIIFIAAHDETDVRETALRRGAIDYLPKPFNCDHLLARVREVLEHGETKPAQRTPAPGGA